MRGFKKGAANFENNHNITVIQMLYTILKIADKSKS